MPLIADFGSHHAQMISVQQGSEVFGLTWTGDLCPGYQYV